MRAFISMLAAAVLVIVGVTAVATPASAVTTTSGTVTLGSPPRVAGSGEVDVRVLSCTAPGAGCSGTVLSGRTDATGVYRVYNLTNGHYAAVASHYMSRFKVATVFFEVTTEQPSPVVDIAMVPANVVSGVVTLGAGAPAGAGDVRVGLAGASARYPTDSSGRFTIPDVQDGAYKLEFDYVGTGSFVDQWSGGVLREDDASEVAVASDTVYDVTLPPGGVLTGSVAAVAPSKAEGMSVIAETPGLDLYTTVVGADGRWTITGLPDRTYDVRAYDGRIGATVTSMNYGASNTVWSVPVAVVNASVTSGLDIVMQKSTVLDGRIYCSGCRAGWSGGNAYVGLEVQTAAGWKPANAQGSDLFDLPKADGAYFQHRLVYDGTYRMVLRSMERTFRPVFTAPFVVAPDVPGVSHDITFIPTDPARDFDGDSSADVLALDPAGAFLLYRGNGTGRFGTKSNIGRGWSAFTAVLSPGDFSGDGNADVLARDSTGKLWMYRGNGAGGWTGGKVQVGSGWQGFTALFSPGDFDLDGNTDVLARDSAGKLYLYRGNGKGGWLGSRLVGTGWQGFVQIIGPGNFDGDQMGTADVLAQKSNGDLYLYRGNGAGGWAGSKLIARGATEYATLIPAGNFDRRNGVDLLARTPSGALYLVPTNGMGEIEPWKLIGSGWNGLKIVR